MKMNKKSNASHYNRNIHKGVRGFSVYLSSYCGLCPFLIVQLKEKVCSSNPAQEVYMEDESCPFVAARATGVASIEEGRIFLLVASRYKEGDLKPIFFESTVYGDNGLPYTMHRAGSDMPILCHCGDILDKGVTPVQTPEWMCLSSLCFKHPYHQWLDFFPKARGPSVNYDFINMFPRYVDTHSLGQKKEHRLYLDFVGIPNDDDTLDVVFTSQPQLYRRWASIAPVEFLLTVDGLVSIKKNFLIEKARKLFFPRKS